VAATLGSLEKSIETIKAEGGIPIETIVL